VGSLLVLFAVGLLGAGGVAMWADQTQRDGGGYLTASHSYRTPAYALAVQGIDLHAKGTPTWALPSSILGTVRIQVTSLHRGAPVFVGIAAHSKASRYLRGVRRAELSNLDDSTVAATAGSGAPKQAPTRAAIWTASRSGTGTQTLTWHVRSGSWTVVVMNADASRGIDIRATAGATVPSLVWIASGLLGAGGLFLLLGLVLIVVGVREPKPRDQIPPFSDASERHVA